MAPGLLSSYFAGFGAKRLSEVEINRQSSNQHEFNGINGFKKLFGSEKTRFNAKYIFLSDDEEKLAIAKETLTWYDARENHPTRSEFRLYYVANDVIRSAMPGDLIVVCKISSTELLCIISPNGSTAEKQLLWLFGLGEVGTNFVVRDLSNSNIELGFPGKYILKSLGIEVEETVPDLLDELLSIFGLEFPSTREFSRFARGKVKDISIVENPDEALIAFLDLEEKLFKTMESEIVQRKLKEGFGIGGIDVDDFISFSLSVQNRRKSRAGHAFENHLSAIFAANSLAYSKGQVTERNNKPDFIFPSIEHYRDKEFPATQLTMLGVKTSAKDRWRQVLSEADRIEKKHLITLQPAISENQTAEMQAQRIELVVPASLQLTYSSAQQNHLISLSAFIALIKSKQ